MFARALTVDKLAIADGLEASQLSQPRAAASPAGVCSVRLDSLTKTWTGKLVVEIVEEGNGRFLALSLAGMVVDSSWTQYARSGSS